MLKFFLNIGGFCLIVLIYFGVNYYINTRIIEQTYPILKGHTLITGASDAQAGIDPTLFDAAQNISQLGEPLFITYWKIKSLIQTNKIDTVIIGVTHPNFSSVYDKSLSPEKPFWARNMFRRSYAIEELAELKEIRIDKFGFYEILFKQMCLIPKKNHHHYIGKYAKHSEELSNPYLSLIHI